MSMSRVDNANGTPDTSDAPIDGGDDALGAGAGADADLLRQQAGGDEHADAVEEAEEMPDYRGFAALLGRTSAPAPTPTPTEPRRKQISSQLIRKGEKDFEEHGTRAQQAALEQSRSVMESVLAYTRVHAGAADSDVLRGWYFPNVWADEEEESVESASESLEMPAHKDASASASASSPISAPRRFIHTRHRVVMVEVGRGTMFASVGAVPGRPPWVKGLSKAEQAPPRPGFDRVWLLPEEALFLVERGSMELWYPLKPIEAILGTKDGDKKGEKGDDEVDKKDEKDDDDDDDEDGLPLSLQAAYSLLIGPDVDFSSDDAQTRGRIPLTSYQVYTHLRRSGYQVLRAVHTDPQTPLDPAVSAASASASAASPVANLWQWLYALVGLGPRLPDTSSRSAYGLLVTPGVYRSYNAIYAQLRLARSPSPPPPPSPPPSSPFRIVFHVWKAGSKDKNAVPFSKSRPPPPDFYMAVADAHTTGVPTRAQIMDLLASVPPVPAVQPKTQKTQKTPAKTHKTPRSDFPPLPVVYRRLKLGRRCVIVSVVDHGIVNYMRFADGTFGTEPLSGRFDAVAAGTFAGRGGGKRGKAGGSKGKGGKGKGGKPGK